MRIQTMISTKLGLIGLKAKKNSFNKVGLVYTTKRCHGFRLSKRDDYF
jgi:hypothetical protein